MKRVRIDDKRFVYGPLVTAVGLLLVLGTKCVAKDSWRDFGEIAAYSIGWALLTFAGLYLLTARFDDAKWDRDDHDLKRLFEEGSE